MLHLARVERQRGSGPGAFTLRVEHFSLGAGDCVAVTGASGSGKSTFLDLLGLVLRPDRADVFEFRGRDATCCDLADWWRRGADGELSALRASEIGYVLQTGGLLPFLNVAQNIRVSRQLLGLAEDGFAAELMGWLAIERLAAKMPQQLSVGERQRVAIARAFAHRPRLVLADEPTAALDPPQALRVCQRMVELAASLGIALVIVSHDWGLVRTLGLPEAVVEPNETPEHSGSCIDYVPPTGPDTLPVGAGAAKASASPAVSGSESPTG
ncbi:ABC transporter ATP-binding protein [Methylolobus aquaticus]|nr:ABC transporter ATP-binding protein [Methylolobus aquaticus]